jgi:hypothetical protein
MLPENTQVSKVFEGTVEFTTPESDLSAPWMFYRECKFFVPYLPPESSPLHCAPRSGLFFFTVFRDGSLMPDAVAAATAGDGQTGFETSVAQPRFRGHELGAIGIDPTSAPS